MNLRTPPRRERRVLLAELQQSRWAINSNPTGVSHDHRRIPHRSCSSNKLWSVTRGRGYGVLLLRDVLCLRSEYTPIDLSTSSRSSDLGCSTAPRRWAAFADHARYLLMAARQTSIISATAPLAPAFITNAETDPVAFTTPVAFTVPSFEPVPTHDRIVTCTVCSCLFASDRQDNPILLSSSTTQQID